MQTTSNPPFIFLPQFNLQLAPVGGEGRPVLLRLLAGRPAVPAERSGRNAAQGHQKDEPAHPDRSDSEGRLRPAGPISAVAELDFSQLGNAAGKA